MKRPLWLLKVVKALFPILKLMDKFAFLNKITKTLQTFPLPFNVLDFSPMKYDLVYSLPRDQVISLDESIEIHPEYVLPSEVVDYFIKRAEHHLIMRFCLCRYSNDCKTYPESEGCLFLGKPVLKISPEFGRLVTKEEALDYVRKVRELGMIQMIGRAFPDAFALGVGPQDELVTICNCCTCCCGLGMFKHIPPKFGSSVYGKLPGIEVKVTDRCIGCGTCTKDICFIHAIEIIDKKAVIDEMACRACGRCVLACPQKAIELNITDRHFLDKAKREIDLRLKQP
ncbi:MAG: 4Fe-4S ferredoxin [Candidatus Lokiarchaeota archaeon]|nr:4Fe-4S ferredoxin [Candidatus Lokiarchaeota archaeon]